MHVVLLRACTQAEAMDLGLGLAQLTPDERRAVRAAFNWRHAVQRFLERADELLELWWGVDFELRQSRVRQIRYCLSNASYQ